MAGNGDLIRISAQDNVSDVVRKLTVDLAALGDQMTKVGQSMTGVGGGAGTGADPAR